MTGLVLGVALARAVGLPAFQRPGFRIHGVPVVPKFVLLHKLFGFMKFESVALTVGRGVQEGAKVIADNGGPDVTSAALRLMREELHLCAELRLSAPYGAHSAESSAAFAAYRERVQGPAPGLWLCGHFTAKSFALLLRHLERDGAEDKKLLFWSTKSVVQPRGAHDEWAAFEAESKSNRALRQYAVVGGMSGHPGVEPASVRPVSCPAEYRGLMSEVAP